MAMLGDWDVIPIECSEIFMEFILKKISPKVFEAEKISRQEKNRWDDFVKTNKSGHIFQSFGWAEFKKSQAWKARRILLKTTTGEIKAGLSILEKQIPLTPYKFYYLPRGPVLDFSDKDLIEQTLDFLCNFGEKNKAVAIKISPELVLDPKTQWLVSLLKTKGFRETRNYQLHKCTIRIDLQRNLQDIFSSFKKNTRWEIKRAEKYGVRIKRAESEKGLKIFYKLYSEALKNDRISFLPYDYFKNLWQIFRDDILILLAFEQGRPLAGVFSACFFKKCWYLFGGSTRKEPTHYSSQFLQWEAIKWAKQKGCSVYDLQGVCCAEPRNKHEQGTLQFKSGFAGKRVELIGEFDYIFSPLVYKFLMGVLYPVYQKLRKIRKK